GRWDGTPWTTQAGAFGGGGVLAAWNGRAKLPAAPGIVPLNSDSGSPPTMIVFGSVVETRIAMSYQPGPPGKIAEAGRPLTALKVVPTSRAKVASARKA